MLSISLDRGVEAKRATLTIPEISIQQRKRIPISNSVNQQQQHGKCMSSCESVIDQCDAMDNADALPLITESSDTVMTVNVKKSFLIDALVTLQSHCRRYLYTRLLKREMDRILLGSQETRVSTSCRYGVYTAGHRIRYFVYRRYVYRKQYRMASNIKKWFIKRYSIEIEWFKRNNVRGFVISRKYLHIALTAIQVLFSCTISSQCSNDLGLSDIMDDEIVDDADVQYPPYITTAIGVRCNKDGVMCSCTNGNKSNTSCSSYSSRGYLCYLTVKERARMAVLLRRDAPSMSSKDKTTNVCHHKSSVEYAMVFIDIIQFKGDTALNATKFYHYFNRKSLNRQESGYTSTIYLDVHMHQMLACIKIQKNMRGYLRRKAISRQLIHVMFCRRASLKAQRWWRRVRCRKLQWQLYRDICSLYRTISSECLYVDIWIYYVLIQCTLLSHKSDYVQPFLCLKFKSMLHNKQMTSLLGSSSIDLHQLLTSEIDVSMKMLQPVYSSKLRQIISQSACLSVDHAGIGVIELRFPSIAEARSRCIELAIATYDSDRKSYLRLMNASEVATSIDLKAREIAFAHVYVVQGHSSSSHLASVEMKVQLSPHSVPCFVLDYAYDLRDVARFRCMCESMLSIDIQHVYCDRSSVVWKHQRVACVDVDAEVYAAIDTPSEAASSSQSSPTDLYNFFVPRFSTVEHSSPRGDDWVDTKRLLRWISKGKGEGVACTSVGLSAAEAAAVARLETLQHQNHSNYSKYMKQHTEQSSTLMKANEDVATYAAAAAAVSDGDGDDSDGDGDNDDVEGTYGAFITRKLYSADRKACTPMHRLCSGGRPEDTNTQTWKLRLLEERRKNAKRLRKVNFVLLQQRTVKDTERAMTNIIKAKADVYRTQNNDLKRELQLLQKQEMVHMTPTKPPPRMMVSVRRGIDAEKAIPPYRESKELQKRVIQSLVRHSELEYISIMRQYNSRRLKAKTIKHKQQYSPGTHHTAGADTQAKVECVSLVEDVVQQDIRHYYKASREGRADNRSPCAQTSHSITTCDVASAAPTADVLFTDNLSLADLSSA